MAFKFLAAGCSETFDTTLFPSLTTSSGSVSSSSSNVHNQARSLKCTGNTGGTNRRAKAQALIGAVSSGGGQFGAYIYFDALPSGYDSTLSTTQSNQLFSVGSSSTLGWGISLSDTGILHAMNGAGSSVATGSTTLSINTLYHIAICWTWTDGTHNEIRVYLNGVLDVSVTNVNYNLATDDRMDFGIDHFDCTSSAVNYYYTDMFITNSTNLSYPGDIRVTAKRPDANGTTNGLTTQVGAGGSGYGSGHSPQVNERALSQTNGWSLLTAGSAITEEYNIESSATGDVDISGKTVLGVQGWVFGKSALSETGQIIVDGTQTNISLTSAATRFLKMSAAITYPAGSGTDIGIVTSTTVTTVTLYECGMSIAYIDAILSTPDVLSVSLTAFAPSVTHGDNALVTPEMLVITTTKYAPTSNVNTHYTPDLIPLVLTEYSPVSIGPELDTPNVLSLSLTQYAPSLNFGIIPGFLELTLAGFSPVDTFNFDFVPGVLGLNLTGYTLVPNVQPRPVPSTLAFLTTKYAPVIINPRTVTPDVRNLVLTGQPTRFGRVAIPGTHSFTFTEFAPSAVYGTEPIVGKLALTTTEYAPSILAGTSVSISKLALILTKFSPFFNDPRTVTPEPLDLTLGFFNVEIHPGPNVSPDTATLATTLYDIVLTYFVTPMPSPTALIITRYAPKAVRPNTATPAVRALVLSRKTVVPHVGANVSIGLQTLVTAFYAPTTSAGVAPDKLALVLTEYAPAPSIGYIIKIGTRSLVLTGYIPMPINTSTFIGTQALHLAFFAPSIPQTLRPFQGVTHLRTVSNNTFAWNHLGNSFVLRRNSRGVRYDKVVTINKRSLVTTRYAPRAIIGIVATPGVNNMTLTKYALAATAGTGGAGVTPDTLAIGIDTFPVNSTPNTVGVLQIFLQPFAPTITSSG